MISLADYIPGGANEDWITWVAYVVAALSLVSMVTVFSRRSRRWKISVKEQERAVAEANLQSLEDNLGNRESHEEVIKKTNKRRVRRAENNRVLRRVDILLARGETDEAERILIEVIADDENNARAHSVLASIYMGRGMAGKAHLLVEKVLDIDPDNLLAHDILGQILLEQKKMGEAVMIYERLTKLDPRNAKYFLDLAQIFSALGEGDRARENFEAALSLEPRNRDILMALAEHLRLNSPPVEYANFLRRVAEVIPYDEELKRRLLEVGME